MANSKNNTEYWEKRELSKVTKIWNDEANVEKELKKQYDLAKSDIQQQVAELYGKYGEENKLSYAEVAKDLTPVDLETYRSRMERLLRMAPTEDIQFQIQRLGFQIRVSRLQALLNEIDARLLLMGYDQQLTIEESLSSSYEESYYQTTYNIAKGLGVGISLAKLDHRAVREAITYPLAGTFFSSAVWDNRATLVRQLRKTLVNGIIQGKSVKEMAKEIDREMKSGRYSAERLIRTETAKVVSEATYKGYKDSKVVNKYQILATLDNRTSEVCKREDGEVYLLSEKQLGVNFPPFHVNCRTTVVPYFDEADLNEATRIARDSSGANYKVTASITFEDWFNRFVA